MLTIFASLSLPTCYLYKEIILPTCVLYMCIVTTYKPKAQDIHKLLPMYWRRNSTWRLCFNVFNGNIIIRSNRKQQQPKLLSVHRMVRRIMRQQLPKLLSVHPMVRRIMRQSISPSSVLSMSRVATPTRAAPKKPKMRVIMSRATVTPRTLNGVMVSAS